MNTERLKKELEKEEKKNFRKKLEIRDDDTVFSYIAELNANKNQILLIKTIEELKKERPNIKLLLIGDGPYFIWMFFTSIKYFAIFSSSYITWICIFYNLT